MKITGKRPPDWAILLVTQVCTDHGRLVPMLQWWERDGWNTSGHYWPQRRQIHITAGVDVLDQQYVLLHELAHHLCPPKWHHNKKFYKRAFALYSKWLPDDLAEITLRESQYMKRSSDIAREFAS